MAEINGYSWLLVLQYVVVAFLVGHKLDSFLLPVIVVLFESAQL